MLRGDTEKAANMKSEEAKIAKRPHAGSSNTIQHGTGLLFKTYLGYVYAAEDVTWWWPTRFAQELFRKGGYEPVMWTGALSVFWRGPDIEVYDKVSPGPLFLMDKTALDGQQG